MVGRKKLPDPSLNHIFNALSIVVQYTLSFQLTNFGLKCLPTVNSKEHIATVSYRHLLLSLISYLSR